MTTEQLIFAAITGALAAGVTTAITAYASKRFGLPGIARQVATEQGALIDTLRDSIGELRDEITNVETKRASCEQEIVRLRGRAEKLSEALRDAKRDLRDTEAELLALYRRTKIQPPKRLVDHEAEDR